MAYIDKIKSIKCVDKKRKETVQKKFDNLIKPVGSLARLEEITGNYIAMQNADDISYPSKHLLLFLSEHEKAAGYQEDVCDKNIFLPELFSGKSHMHKLVKFFAADMTIVSLSDEFGIKAKGEMADSAFKQAFQAGEKAVQEVLKKDVHAIALASFSPYSYLPDLAVLSAVTGRIDFIPPEMPLLITADEKEEVFNAIKKHGGYELPAMVGAITCAASNGAMIFLDGIGTLLAAYAAISVNDALREYLVAVSTTNENGQNILLTESKLSTMLDLKMNFPSGEAALFGFSLLEAGIKALLEMESFGEVHFPLGDMK